TGSSCTPRTGICSTSSSPRAAIAVPTATAGRSRTGCGSWSRGWRRGVRRAARGGGWGSASSAARSAGPRGGCPPAVSPPPPARLERDAPVDFLDVSVGLSGAGMVRPLYAPHAFGVYAAATVKRAVVRTPVFTVHRILTPEEAEGILVRGDADAVTLVRALIA